MANSKINTGFLLLLLFLIGTEVCFAQGAAQPISKGRYTMKICFGGITDGPIAIRDHLADSLAFTDPEINSWYRVSSFNLALKCNGNVIKYLVNKSGNKLTPEMKEAILQLHPGCSLVFDGIKVVSLQRDINGKHEEFKYGMLKLVLKK